MLSRLNKLRSDNKISKDQVDLFLLFTEEQGANFLRNQLLCIAMEELPKATESEFSWSDG